MIHIWSLFGSLFCLSACPGERCYGEMLLLVALHLQDRQLNQIEELITSVLKMKTHVGEIRVGRISSSMFVVMFVYCRLHYAQDTSLHSESSSSKCSPKT